MKNERSHRLKRWLFLGVDREGGSDNPPLKAALSGGGWTEREDYSQRRTRRRMTPFKALTSRMTVSSTWEPRSTMV